MIELTDVQKQLVDDKVKKILAGELSIKEAVDMDPEMFEWLYGVAYRFYQSGTVDEALPFFYFLSRVDPGDSRFPMGMAACYYRKKQYREAIQNYLQVVYFADPNDPMPWYYIADCYLKIDQKWAAAIALSIFVMLAQDKKEHAKNKEKATQMLLSLADDLSKEKVEEKKTQEVS